MENTNTNTNKDNQVRNEEAMDYKPESNMPKESIVSNKRIACSAELQFVIIAEMRRSTKDFTNQEHFGIIALNNKNQVLKNDILFSGASTQINIDLSIIFKPLILSNAVKFVIWHNHPSDDVQPSMEDVLLTQKISEAGKMLGIHLLDHLVVDTKADYYLSMADRGLLQ